MKTCPRCRSEYPDDALFCAECGASLAETPMASATPAATLSEAAQLCPAR
ncbi:MAG: zinc-ribbon domain-containing protein [Christensenellaceae bacterium]